MRLAALIKSTAVLFETLMAILQSTEIGLQITYKKRWTAGHGYYVSRVVRVLR
jgi:hypothetical protein